MIAEGKEFPTGCMNGNGNKSSSVSAILIRPDKEQIPFGLSLSKPAHPSTGLYGVCGTFLRDWKVPGWRAIDWHLPLCGQTT